MTAASASRDIAAGSHGGTEALKWLALALMTVDHVGQFLVGLDSPVGVALFMLGRLAFPLFAWVMAVRLVENPARVGGYLRRLVPMAVISQPVYAFLLDGVVPAGASWTAAGDYLASCFLDTRPNIMFVLAAGALIALPATVPGPGFRVRHVLAVVAGIWGAVLLDMTLAWALLVGLMAYAAHAGLGRRAAIVAATPIVANYMVIPLAFPAAVGLPLLLLAAGRCGRWVVPRLPGWLFYAYYPAHLGVIAALIPAVQ